VNVWYWNGEDPMEELQRRIVATALLYKIEPTEIHGRLFVDTGRETKIIIAEQTNAGARIARPIVDAVIATINAIGLMIVDPFVASHRVIQNDNPAIELVAATWAEIADVTGCAIELVPMPARRSAAPRSPSTMAAADQRFSPRCDRRGRSTA
jgi:hypothetical protein